MYYIAMLITYFMDSPIHVSHLQTRSWDVSYTCYSFITASNNLLVNFQVDIINKYIFEQEAET